MQCGRHLIIKLRVFDTIRVSAQMNNSLSPHTADELGRSRYVLCLAATNHMSRKSAEHGFSNSKVGRVGSEGEGRSPSCLATAQTTILLSSSMTVRNAVALCSFFYDGCIK